MAQLWEVVGGVDKGGILVRQGNDVKSPALSERLSTGALIEELDLFDSGRLHYRRITGTGPEEGWVTIKLADKALCVQTDRLPENSPFLPSSPEAFLQEQAQPEPPVPPGASRDVRPACETVAAYLPCSVLPPLKKYLAKQKLRDAAAKRCMGDLYGLPFPQTPEEMLTDPKFGAGWLTKAFHAAGSLPKDNSVTRIVGGKRFEGGGSGPKARFEVEYEKPDDSLDTTLFAKMPHPLWENEQQRWIQEGQGKFGDNFGGEISFYRFLSPHVPFPVPKFYFGDMSRESTEAILINACVKWPEGGITEFAPYEVFPPCEKCEDYTLTSPQDYYFAIMRRMGTFSGLAKCNKLGPEVEKINWYNCTQTNDVNCLQGFPGTEASVRTFIEVIAPHWFPAKVKDNKVLDKFVKEFESVCANHKVIVEYLYSDPLYIGLCHQNGNTDNCYFYRREDGTIDAGVLDWGSTASMSYGTGFMGSTISALAEMMTEYDDRFIRIWADAYHATGAPKLDFADLLLRYRIATCVNSYGIFNSTNQYASPKSIEGAKTIFATCEAWNCDAIRKDFGMRFGMGMLYNRIMLFLLKGDVYWGAVQELLRRSPVKK